MKDQEGSRANRRESVAEPEKRGQRSEQQPVAAGEEKASE